MSNSFNQIFFLRKFKAQQESAATIYLRITVNGICTEISTQRSCDPKKWVAGMGRISGKSEEVKSVNKFLDVMEHRIYEIYWNLMVDGKTLTPELIKGYYFGVSEKTRLLVEVYNHHNDQLASLVGRDYAMGY